MDISAEIAAIQAASQGSELRQPLVGALNKLNSGSLPAVTASDAGKILKVNSNGEWVAGEKSGYIPVPTASLSITENGTVDVSNYAQAVVAVSGGGGAIIDTTKMYYNGYLLPVLPIISEYEYVWIRQNNGTGYYDAIYGRSIWYSANNTSTTLDNWHLKTASMPDYKWYRVPIQGASNATWVEYTGTNYETMGTSGDRDIIWTNYDILDGLNDGGIILKHGIAVSYYVNS